MAHLAEHAAASMDHPDRWVPRLQRLLDRQHGLYTELDTLSRQQGGHIESGDTSALLSVLTARQTIIDQIATVNTDLDPFVRSWSRLLAQVTPDQRTDLESRFSSIDTLVAGIARRDDDDRHRLETRRKSVSDSIASASRARAAASAYTGADTGARTAVAPRYQDREA